jgi:hypothetical protein
MDKGILAFSLNGASMGIAYTDPGLRTGPIYPAVALVHCAGCVIKGELPIPSQFQGVWLIIFELLFLYRNQLYEIVI